MHVLHGTQGDVSERFTCATVLPNGKAGRMVYDVAATASVVAPVLDTSARALLFHYRYAGPTTSPDGAVTAPSPPAVQVQQLTVRNISKLPVCASLRVQAPFAIDRTTLQLGRFEGATLNVSFDPTFKGDQKSGVIKHKMQVWLLSTREAATGWLSEWLAGSAPPPPPCRFLVPVPPCVQ
jgi:hypothetical protein